MLSVLHVISRMPPWGTELQLAGLLNAAHGVEWNATLCVLYPGFPLAREVRNAGVPVIELDGSSRVHLDRLSELRKVVRSGRHDVIHTSLWGASAFTRTAVLGLNRPAVVMTEQRVEEFRPLHRRVMDRMLRPATDAWTGNSRDVCDFIVCAHRAPAARVYLLDNAVDTNVFHPCPQRSDQRGGLPRLGTLGRLVHQKGLDVLLAALPTVLAARGIELEIAGDGELRDELERAATGLPVTFRGRIDGPSAVADYLRSLDVYIMPSRYEGLPNAMLEALSCGVRVVATEAPGMAEATRGAVRLVPPDDPEALAQAILHTLEQPATTSRPEWPSFEQAAVAHRSVFEHALVRRRRLAGAGRARRALDDPTSVPSGSLLRREILDRVSGKTGAGRILIRWPASAHPIASRSTGPSRDVFTSAPDTALLT